jgi:hypothetical protein
MQSSWVVCLVWACSLLAHENCLYMSLQDLFQSLISSLCINLLHIQNWIRTVGTSTGQLGMRHTSFRPVDTTDFNPMIVPTEVDQMHRNRLLWGEGLVLLQSFQTYSVHSMNCSMPSLWIVVELQNKCIICLEV